MSQLTEHLSRIPLLSGCSARDLDHLARSTDEVRVPRGSLLTRQGDIGREAFVILAGTATVERDGTAIAELVVGELALLDGGTRSATVVATTDVDALVLTRPAFTAALDEIPTLAHRLLVTLARRLRAAEDPTGG